MDKPTVKVHPIIFDLLHLHSLVEPDLSVPFILAAHANLSSGDNSNYVEIRDLLQVESLYGWCQTNELFRKKFDEINWEPLDG